MAWPQTPTVFTTKLPGPGNIVRAADANAWQTAINQTQGPLLGPTIVNPLDPQFGALGNVHQVSDGAITSGTAILQSSTANFTTNAIAGQAITVAGAAAAGAVFAATILSITDSQHVVLNTNASTTVSGATVSFGTDDSTAIQAAITACAAAGGGIVWLPAKTYGLTVMPVVPSTVQVRGYAATLRWLGSGTTTAVLSVGAGSGAAAVGAGLQGLTLDANGINGNGLSLHSSQLGAFPDIKILNATAVGLNLRADAASGGYAPFANQNTAFNTFTNLFIDNCTTNIAFVGTASGYVTDNFFFGTGSWRASVCALDFQAYCDSNHFYGFEGSLSANNAIGFRFNSSASVDQGVYDINIFGCSIEEEGTLTGCKAFQFNKNANQIDVRQCYDAPAPWVGTFIDDHNSFGWRVEAVNENPTPGGTVYTKAAPEEFLAGAGSSGGTKLFNGGGGSYVLLGDCYTPSPGSFGGMAFGVTTLTSSNWNFISSGADAYFNANGPLHFRSVNNEMFMISTSGHLVSEWTAAPTAAAGANAGGSPPAPVVNAASNDMRGSLTFGTGTTPALGDLCDVTFAAAYGAAPFVKLTPTTAAAAALQWYVTATTGGFVIHSGTAPTASQANTVYGFTWEVIG